MAGEVAELKVKITGDAASLESTIKGVEKELERLQKTGQKGNSGTAAQKNNTAAAKQNTQATEENTSAKKRNASASDTSAKSEDKDTAATQKNTAAKEQSQKAATKSAENLKKLGKSWKDAGDAIDTVTKPLQVGAVALAAGGVAAAKFAIDFEDNFAAVEKTVEGTPEQLEKVKQGIIDLSTVGIDGRSAIPQTTAELTELAAIGGQLGIETDNLIEFTETMAQLGTATNLVGEEGAKTLARFMNVTQTSQDQVKNLGSSIVYLGNNYATTEAEIAEMAMRLGRTGTLVGMSAADILGYSTALSSLGINAEAGGSAVSRTWTRIDNAVATGGEALSMFAEVSGQTAEAFQQSWETDASEAFNSFIKGLAQAEKLPLLLQELGIEDIREGDALKALSLGFETMTQAVNDANAAWSENTALQNEFDTKAATTASQIQIMKNNLVEAARSIGETFLPDLVNATAGISDFAQGIAQMDDGTKQALITTGKWVIGLGAASKVVSGGVKSVGNLLDAVGKIKGAFGAKGLFGAGSSVQGASLAASGIAKLTTSLSALSGVASALGPLALFLAIPTATVVGMKLYQNHLEEVRQELLHSGEGAKELTNQTYEAARAAQELEQNTKRLEELNRIINSGGSGEDPQGQVNAAIEEKKALIQWFNDNYGEYLTNIEKEQGISKQTAENLQSLTVAERENMQAKMANKMSEAGTSVPQLQQEIRSLEQENQGLLSKNTLLNQLQAGVRGYVQEMGAAKKAQDLGLDGADQQIEAVSEKYKYLNDIIKELGGNTDIFLALHDLNTGDLENTEDVINKIGDAIMDNDAALERNRGDIETATKSLNDWRAAAQIANDLLISELPNAMQQGSGKVQEYINKIGEYGRAVGFSFEEMGGYANQAALKLNGFNTVAEAAADQNGGLDASVRDCVNTMRQWGASAEQAATQGALLKNGFRTIDEAANAGALEIVSEQANELAQTMENFPDGGTITITAEGDISLIGYAQEQVNGLLSNGDVTVGVNSEGETTLLDKAQNEVTELEGIGKVHVEVQADGSINVLDEANQLVANIPPQVDSSVSVDYTKGEQEPPEEQNATVNYEKGWQNSPSDENAKVNYTLGSQADPINKTAYVDYVTRGGGLAKGTQNFSGGLAMINDQKGISDPRELVEFGGKGYIFEGKDVVLPLPKGAKVWTAAQTKAIMAGRGIPHYAGGKNNEAWDAAQDDWRHYTKINNVSAVEELAHWDEMLKKFADDAEVVKEIQEEIVDSTKKMWDETLDTLEFNLDMGWISTEEYYRQLAEFRDANFAPDTEEWRDATLELHRYSQDLAKAENEASLSWLEHMGNTNDWEEIGDSMSAAYARVMERNDKNLADGILTLEEYEDVANDTFTTLLDGYTNYSDNWVDRQKQYFGMSADEAVAATERQIAEVEKLYASLENVTEEQFDAYITVHTELENQKMDNQRDVVDDYVDDVEWYRRQNEVYGWGFMNPGETEIDTLKRAQDELWKLYEDADPTKQKEILRQIDEYDLEIFQLQQDSIDEFFNAASEAIDAAREEFNKQEEALRESWEVEDRAESKEEIQAQLDQYKYAVTKEGKDKYESLQEQMKEIEREEELYELQKKNNAIIEQMEADLEAAEAEKKQIMEQVEAGTLNIQALMEKINNSNDDSSIAGVLSNILEKMDNVSVVSNSNFTQNNYNQVPDVTTATAFGNAAGRSFQYDSYGG